MRCTEKKMIYIFYSANFKYFEFPKQFARGLSFVDVRRQKTDAKIFLKADILEYFQLAQSSYHKNVLKFVLFVIRRKSNKKKTISQSYILYA